jgi:hemerythrin-like domain-containing protein
VINVQPAGLRPGRKPVGADFIASLRADHAQFSRVLSVLSRQSGALHTRAVEVLPVLREALHYVAHYQDVYHHPREDLMYARLALRNPRLRTRLERLRREHRKGISTANRLYEGLSRIDADEGRRRSVELGRSLDRFAEEAREHIRQEEELIYARAESALRRKDWAVVLRKSPLPDPLTMLRFGPSCPYPALAEHFERGVGEVVSGPDSLIEVCVLEPVGEFAGRIVGCMMDAAALATRQSREAIQLGTRSFRELAAVTTSPLDWWTTLREMQQRNAAAVRGWAREWRGQVVCRSL